MGRSSSLRCICTQSENFQVVLRFSLNVYVWLGHLYFPLTAYCHFEMKNCFFSGLAVRPNPEDLFSRAEHDASAKTKTKITMYKGGFVVDDGPYRALDDPANADFLRAIAIGRVPAELVGGTFFIASF